MANRINYEKEMEKTLDALAARGERPRLLLHACCAPCSSATLERLAGHFELTILYYNPNIYPPEEYRRREAELERFVQDAGYAGVPVVELPYDPQEFYSAVKGLEEEPERGGRCTVCYRLRLERAAQYAAANGFAWFTTTLSISPVKDPVRLNAIGTELAEQYGLHYLQSEFRKKRRLQTQPGPERPVRAVPAGLLRLRVQQAGAGRVSARHAPPAAGRARRGPATHQILCLKIRSKTKYSVFSS